MENFWEDTKNTIISPSWYESPSFDQVKKDAPAFMTRPHATVEVEISEDMQLVHFDFNSTPFELHDDNYVLKAMKFCERPQSDNVPQNVSADGGESSMANVFQPQVHQPSIPSIPARPPTSPPLPGILKARVKHEH